VLVGRIGYNGVMEGDTRENFRAGLSLIVGFVFMLVSDKLDWPLYVGIAVAVALVAAVWLLSRKLYP
jgi:ABC-type antimicrobial peptide transport system permease subunit